MKAVCPQGGSAAASRRVGFGGMLGDAVHIVSQCVAEVLLSSSAVLSVPSATASDHTRVFSRKQLLILQGFPYAAWNV